MKISEDQKNENRIRILRAAVKLIEEKGFKSVTMREIARAGEVGDATIYHYFPTKESIVCAYYADHAASCIAKLKDITDFHTYNLQEQLQTLFDTSLSLYLADKEFVARTFRMTLLGGSANWGRIQTIRAPLLAAILEMIDAAEEVGEIPEQVFQNLIGQFFLDAYIAVLLYWLADTSERFVNTRVIIDRGLDLACALLKAGIANKVFDIATFLFKNHILDKLNRLADSVGEISRIKRRFMEKQDE